MSKRLRSQFIVAGLVVLATAVAVPVALGTTASAASAATRGRTITVVGTGEVRGTPDVADLVLGVSGRAGSAADAMARIADRAQKVIDALHDAGVSDDDIQTADLSVQPVYDDDGNVKGYEASNTVSVRIRDLTKAGAVVDAAAAKAGDDIRVQGITFSIDDDSVAAGGRPHQGHQAGPGPGRAAGERCRGGGRRGALDHRVDRAACRSTYSGDAAGQGGRALR